MPTASRWCPTSPASTPWMSDPVDMTRLREVPGALRELVAAMAARDPERMAAARAALAELRDS